MAIKSDATPDEYLSPFYIYNKRTFDEFESLILSKNSTN